MSYKILILSLVSFFAVACDGGFERFAPPANSITGRGAKQNPKILSTTPSDGATISPVTGSTGTQIKVIFDMTMNTGTTPVINTYVRDIGTNSIVWYSVANSGAMFTWSSTSYANDTLTIQLGWVRWPEDNIIGFDFDNSSLTNLDDMPLDNSKRLTFTVGWDSGRYKIVQTGQYACYRYQTSGTVAWIEEAGCLDSSNGSQGVIGSQDYPAGQNGFVDSMNNQYVSPLYGSARGTVFGRRFSATAGISPQNMVSANCNGNANDPCYPYSADAVTTLIWKTCSQGQTYQDVGDKCFNSGTDFTWGEAVNACSGMNTADNGQGYGGRKDWRLPTVQELENLVDYGARVTVGTPEPGLGYPEGPAIHGYQAGSYPFFWEGPFPNTPITQGFWTATGISALANGVVSYGNAFVVEFKKGAVGAGSTGSLDSRRATTNRKKVRCVAGPAVLPQPPSLVPTVASAGASLVGTGATFAGFDSNAAFVIKGVTPAYAVEIDEHSVIVDFNKVPNSVQAGSIGNYCIAAATATSCAGSSPAISTSLQASGSTTAYKLTLGSAMGSNSAYKLFVSNIQTASDQWQTAQSYSANTYLYDSGNVYRAVNAHTSSSIAANVGSGDLVLLAQFAASTSYALNTKLYVPSLSAVVNVQSSYTSTASAQTDINNGFLVTVKDLIISPQQALALTRALFNGTPRLAAPAASTVFNVLSASSPSLTSVQVTFNRLPNATQAAVSGNYCIISATANPWDCSTPLVGVSSAAVSGYTVTLTPTAPLAAGTAYAVLASNITYLGSQIVDDNINKLRWQRCRKGNFDNATCADDGDASNDAAYWNDALNYCASLNATKYDGYVTTSRTDPYGWRAPTINELKSIANRSLFATLGYSIDTTIFPTPNPLAEDFVSSTNYSMNGNNTAGSSPNYNLAWGFNYIAGFSSIVQKDYSTLLPVGLKPPKKTVRCVRNLP